MYFRSHLKASITNAQITAMTSAAITQFKAVSSQPSSSQESTNNRRKLELCSIKANTTRRSPLLWPNAQKRLGHHLVLCRRVVPKTQQSGFQIERSVSHLRLCIQICRPTSDPFGRTLIEIHSTLEAVNPPPWLLGSGWKRGGRVQNQLTALEPRASYLDSRESQSCFAVTRRIDRPQAPTQQLHQLLLASRIQRMVRPRNLHLDY